MEREYYKAYDERYETVHSQTGLAWAGDKPSEILKDLLARWGATEKSSILEIGCGEGQNALYLNHNGYNIVATDVSQAAIRWCRQKAQELGVTNGEFFLLDAVKDKLNEKFDYIYSVSTLHMLVLDSDRKAFLDFIYSHLNDNGIAIITVMGDGEMEKKDCDISKAYDLSPREFAGDTINVASTSCKIVNWQDLFAELSSSRLAVNEHFVSGQISGFNVSMVVVVSKEK